MLSTHYKQLLKKKKQKYQKYSKKLVSILTQKQLCKCVSYLIFM